MPTTFRSLLPTLAIAMAFVLLLSACGDADDGPTLDADAPTPTVADVADDAGTESDDGGGGDTTTTTDQPADDGDSSDSDDSGSDDDGDDAAPADGTDGTGDDAPPADDAGPSADAEVIFSLFVTGGFVPVDIALSEFPELVVYSDGSVYRPAGEIPPFPRPLTPALERLQLGADELAIVEAAIEASGVIDAGIDFGQPGITDVPFTNVAARVDGNLVEIEAYALGFDEGVGDAAAADRAALASLIDTVRGAADAAAGTAVPAQPPSLAVLSFPGLQYQENAAVLDWPVDAVPQPAPPGADCVVVTGEDVATLWSAAADATTQTPWSVGGATKALAFRPVFPHEDFC